jgi:hypothetical protein
MPHCFGWNYWDVRKLIEIKKKKELDEDVHLINLDEDEENG